MNSYKDFLQKKGRQLAEINPGSKEIALSIDDALKGIDILLGDKIQILGGEVLSEKNGRLIYAYQLWGEEFISLSWYCDQTNDENESDYLKRGYQMAKDRILNAKKIANKLKKKSYIVLVTR